MAQCDPAAAILPLPPGQMLFDLIRTMEGERPEPCSSGSASCFGSMLFSRKSFAIFTKFEGMPQA